MSDKERLELSVSRWLTVGELREALADLDQDMKVGIRVPSGDYWGTTLVHGVHEIDECQKVVWSEYHICPRLPKEHDEPSDADEEPLAHTHIVMIGP